MFRGTERSKLILLAGIMVCGWVVVALSAFQKRPAPPPPPPRVAPPAEPDRSIEFQGIQDKQPFNRRENPAYRILIERARKHTSDQLSAISRRDVTYSQVIETPDLYRGVPIRVEGTARRILVQDVKGSTVFPKGRYYEAYVFTPDSQTYPWLLVFEDRPPNLPIGDMLQEHVAFNGYFFKLVAYLAGDKGRFAPVLVGRITPVTVAPSQPINWTVVVVGVLTLVCFVRFIMLLSRMTGRRRPMFGTPERPSDKIAPEALNAWLSGNPAPAEKDNLEDEFP